MEEGGRAEGEYVAQDEMIAEMVADQQRYDQRREHVMESQFGYSFWSGLEEVQVGADRTFLFCLKFGRGWEFSVRGTRAWG